MKVFALLALIVLATGYTAALDCPSILNSVNFDDSYRPVLTSTDATYASLCDVKNYYFPGFTLYFSFCDTTSSLSTLNEKDSLTATLLNSKNALVKYIYADKISTFTQAKWKEMNATAANGILYSNGNLQPKAAETISYSGAVVNQQGNKGPYCLSPLADGSYIVQIVAQRNYTLGTGAEPISATEIQSVKRYFDVKNAVSDARRWDTSALTTGVKHISYDYTCPTDGGARTIGIRAFYVKDSVETVLRIIAGGYTTVEVRPQPAYNTLDLFLTDGTNEDHIITQPGTSPIISGTVPFFGGKTRFTAKLTQLTGPSVPDTVDFELTFICPKATFGSRASNIIQTRLGSIGRRLGNFIIISPPALSASVVDQLSREMAPLEKEAAEESGGKILPAVTKEQTCEKCIGDCLSQYPSINQEIRTSCRTECSAKSPPEC